MRNLEPGIFASFWHEPCFQYSIMQGTAQAKRDVTQVGTGNWNPPTQERNSLGVLELGGFF
jgi:hypothetical protein